MTKNFTNVPPKKSPNTLPIVQIVRPYLPALTIALLAVVVETCTDVVEPWPIKIVVDNLLQGKRLPARLTHIVWGLFGQNRLGVLNFAVALVAAIAVLGAVSSYVEGYTTSSVSKWIAHDLRKTLYNHIQRLSLTEYDENRTGDLISRVTGDIELVEDFVDSAALGVLVNSLTLVGMIGVMFYVSWRFTLIALAISPVLFLVVFYFTRRIKTASRAVRKKESELLSLAQEVLTSIRTVKAFAREDYEQKRFESQSLENVEAALQARNVKAKLAPVVEVIVAVGTCLVLWYGARLALLGQLTAGMLIVFLLYLGKMYKPMRELSKMSDTVSKAAVGYERIAEVLKMESAVRDLPRARRAPRFKGQIQFDHVSFSYDQGNPVLKDVSIDVEPGQTAAIVGPSGTGKTTIISLIPRFYDPQAGRVTIDGADIRRVTMKSLREQMSFVLQDTLLFRASIWENIAYGKPTASRAEIVHAAEVANAREFIEKMPERYDTLLGERGLTLSGGQRQRIAIARAVIRDTPILILDEPTSGLDAASEEEVIEALERLMKNRTTVLIAHHLSTVRRADVIFVLKDSELVERGSHDELMRNAGMYAELYALQNAEGAQNAGQQRAAAKELISR